MKSFFVKFSYMKPYPKEFSTRQTATSMGTAVNRAFRELKVDNNIRGVKEITIKIIKI